MKWTLRHRIANWFSGGAYRKKVMLLGLSMKNHSDAMERSSRFMNEAFSHRETLAEIAAMATPKCAPTARKMADRAIEGLGE